MLDLLNWPKQRATRDYILLWLIDLSQLLRQVAQGLAFSSTVAYALRFAVELTTWISTQTERRRKETIVA